MCLNLFDMLNRKSALYFTLPVWVLAENREIAWLSLHVMRRIYIGLI